MNDSKVSPYSAEHIFGNMGESKLLRKYINSEANGDVRK